jgi:signal transduction histidine kinase
VNAVKLVPPLEIDPRKVAQAINALLKNEIKCSRPGSRIEILIDADDADATITVRDQGPGISAADLRTLFDPLRSVRPKRGVMEARTALTLATVKRIVEGQGGAVRVASAVRKGSTFTLALPLPDAAGRRSRRIDKRIAIG